jgi:hypothetical protein
MTHQALDEIGDVLVTINVDTVRSIPGDTTEDDIGFCYDTLLVEHIHMVTPSLTQEESRY